MEKLIKIQKELKAPKNQYNNFGKYKYRSCEDILEALKPLLAEEKLLLTIEDKIVSVGNRVYVKAIATITDGEKQVSVSAYAREAEDKKGMDTSQITGATSSYARKYALNGLFLIDDTKDADTDEQHKVVNNIGENLKKVEVKTEKSKKWAEIKSLVNDITDQPFIEEKEYKGIIEKKTGLELKDENIDEIIDRLNVLKDETNQSNK
jgi:hypothetical protein